jgi:phosphoribosylformylglycinamidine synthase
LAVHDVSDGGLLVAVAEMALAGGKGVALEAGPDNIPAHAAWFGEDQGRYVVAVSPGKAEAVFRAGADANVPVGALGTIGGDTITLPGEDALPLATLRAAHEAWLPDFMAQG